jgi:ribonuclease HI
MYESERIFPKSKKRYKLKISREEMESRLKGFDSEYEKKIKNEEVIKPYNFIIYTDGGFNQRNRIGSWSYLIKVRYNKKRFKLYKGSGIMAFGINLPILTELKAVIEAVKFIMSEINKKRYKYSIASVSVYSDSKQVVNSREMYKRYVENNWNFVRSEYEMYDELKEAWTEINELNEKLNIEYRWIKGHNGNINNEYVDKVCTSRIKERLHQEKIYRYNNQILKSYPSQDN